MGDDLHRLDVVAVEEWVGYAADALASAITDSIEQRGRCLFALSGGSTPGAVFAELATRDLAWNQVVLLQADERLVEQSSPDRNLVEQRHAFDGLGVTWMPLPVDELLDEDRSGDEEAVEAVLAAFTDHLLELAGDPPVIDIAQLGLGADGHTASLVANDPALDELRAYVAMTNHYQGVRRLSLTRPVFDRARCVIWLTRGQEKADPLGRLLAGDLSIPAGTLRPRYSLIIADDEAARQN